MRYYINFYDVYQRATETINEFANSIEATLACRDYCASDPSGRYWVSTRCTRECKNK